jgi:hypothetical protein
MIDLWRLDLQSLASSLHRGCLGASLPPCSMVSYLGVVNFEGRTVVPCLHSDVAFNLVPDENYFNGLNVK